MNSKSCCSSFARKERKVSSTVLSLHIIYKLLGWNFVSVSFLLSTILYNTVSFKTRTRMIPKCLLNIHLFKPKCFVRNEKENSDRNRSAFFISIHLLSFHFVLLLFLHTFLLCLSSCFVIFVLWWNKLFCTRNFLLTSQGKWIDVWEQNSLFFVEEKQHF